MKILIYVRFVGTAYAGYQVQQNAPTIQKCLCDAAEKLFGFPCDITGCSRTDSGVHANMFCATVSKKGGTAIETTIPVQKIPRAINAFLPSDIGVFDAESVSDSFHPRYDVKYKEYIYLIHNCAERNPFFSDRYWQLPKPIDETGLENMRLGASCFVGTQDFSAFMASGSKLENTVRTVKYAELECEGDVIRFKVAADGFLYNMVRIMTGTLVQIAYGNIKAQDLPEIISSCDRTRAGMTAPPCGLYLNRVIY